MSCLALYSPSPSLYNTFTALYSPFPVNKFPISDDPRVLNITSKIGKPAPFFASFFSVSVTPFNRISLSSKALTIFIISLISSLENITVVPESCIFFEPHHQYHSLLLIILKEK